MFLYCLLIAASPLSQNVSPCKIDTQETRASSTLMLWTEKSVLSELDEISLSPSMSAATISKNKINNC